MSISGAWKSISRYAGSFETTKQNIDMNLKGTKREKNLLEAFAGESMARNKYTF